MKKYYLILMMCIFFIPKLFCQKSDTLRFVLKNKKQFLNLIGSNKVINDTVYYVKYSIDIGNKVIGLSDEEIFNYDSIYLAKLSNLPFCIINDKKGNKMIECFWSGEYYDKEYKEYYKNGNLKISGQYGSNKAGTWYYYRRNGKLKKIEEYPPDNIKRE